MKFEIVHFKPAEFRCPCCVAGGCVSALAFFLELFRKAWGEPVRVNSGFRCGAHNAEVGGAKESRHLVGCAADIAPLGRATPAFGELARRFFTSSGWELRVYPRYVHVAVPREAARFWAGEGTEVRFERFL